MKLIFKKILVCVLLLAAVVCSASCGESDDVTFYSDEVWSFTLPKDMKKMNVTTTAICYGNGEAVFFAEVFSRDEILTELFIDKDVSIDEYADILIELNEYTEVEKKLIPERNAAIIKYAYEPEDKYYGLDFVTRNYDLLYTVTMSCDYELKDKYEELFEEWVEKIVIHKVPKAD
jgi:ABC-type glycerol-3-phosphate transport system substrate-binding protein